VTVYASLASGYNESLLPAGVVLIQPNQLAMTRNLQSNAGGVASLSVPLNNPGLAGRTFYLQAHLPSSTLGQQLSNALELIICP